MRIDYFPDERPGALLHLRQLGRCTGPELLMAPALRVLDCYVIHYHLADKAYYHDAGCGRCIVHPGDVVISYPGRPHELNPQPGAAIDLYFAAFDGQLADVLFAQLDVAAHAVFTATPGAVIASLFAELLALTRTGIPYHRDQATVVMHALIVETLYRKQGAQLARGDDDPCARFHHFAHAHLAETTLPLQEFLAREGLSYETFRKRFRRLAGQAPHAYWLAQKVAFAKQLLLQQTPVQEVAAALGFADTFYFSRLFKARTGMSPMRFRDTARRFC